ncbi:hypothetical protein SK128_010436 [Halocaridina rubra]|uniref:Uncharacterized protein n=1 Tax=Halocaridina rubra TaxID=373956 RepID=A0AAN9A0F0_HALRR
MFTSRKVSFTGGLLCFLGLMLGAFATSMNFLILSVGVLTGLGAGLTTTPGVLIVSLYFEKRRALASAICVSGNALGGFFMPPLVEYLVEIYGFRGTLIVLAAMQLHICAASVLYRPIRQHALIQAQDKSFQDKTDSNECKAPVPEHNKLLSNSPNAAHAMGAPVSSAPGTPMTRSHAIFQKMVRKRLASISTTDEDRELQGQVSFLRSSSMMNSIPDLTRYARSWSISGERSSMGSRSSIRMAMGSKSSLSKLSIGTSSKSSLSRLAMGNESKHQPLMRLTSDGDQKVAKHPTLLRLTSEEESFGIPHNSSSSSRQSLSRLSTEGRPVLTRQSSTRRVQGRIMTAVKEQDTDSQVSDEVEEQTPKASDKEQDATEQKPENLKSSEIRDDKIEKDHDDDDDGVESEENKAGCCYAFIISCFDFSLFKNPLFIMVSLSVFFMASGAPHALFFLPAYAESVDIPSSKTPQMLSISSMVDLIGRLGIGFVSDLGIFRISDLYFISASAAGIAVLLVTQMTNFSTLSAVLCLYGFGVGAWFVLIPTLLARHHGAARLASSYGLVRLMNGCMNFISPQVNGLLVDTTGSFTACYYFMGTAMVISAVLVLVEPFLVVYVNKKEKNKKDLQQVI